MQGLIDKVEDVTELLEKVKKETYTKISAFYDTIRYRKAVRLQRLQREAMNGQSHHEEAHTNFSHLSQNNGGPDQRLGHIPDHRARALSLQDDRVT